MHSLRRALASTGPAHFNVGEPKAKHSRKNTGFGVQLGGTGGVEMTARDEPAVHRATLGLGHEWPSVVRARRQECSGNCCWISGRGAQPLGLLGITQQVE